MKHPIQFVTARNLFAGVSEDSFAPDQSTTRGMMVTVLYQLAGAPYPAVPPPTV